MKKLLPVLITIISFAGLISAANAGPIIAPTSGIINSSGPGSGSLSNTYNQAGLLSGYTNGVTDFDTYLATNPMHSYIFAGNEWFSNSGTNSASVTYNLGGTFTIDALALWNDEASGIGILDLYTSLDGISFTSLVSGLIPTDNPQNTNYGADVFGFSAINTQYIRFDMSRCPQANNIYTACAIGEVAFRSSSIPEPATLALFGIGLLGLGYRNRKLKRTGI